MAQQAGINSTDQMDSTIQPLDNWGQTNCSYNCPFLE